MPSLFTKNEDWQSEHEYRFVVNDWDETACLLPIGPAFVGLALGASLRAQDMPVVERVAARFGIVDRVAQMILNGGVLQAWPAQDPVGGNLTIWTDADTRTNRIFESE